MKTYLHVVGGLALLFPQVPHAMSADGRALPRIVMASLAPPLATALANARTSTLRAMKCEQMRAAEAKANESHPFVAAFK